MTHELMDSVVRRATELGVPISAHIDLTYRCNERCIHCYLHHEAGYEMSTEEVCRALDQLADAGTLFLIISGGEPLLRVDALEIVAHARELSFSVKLKTNATLVTPEIARKLSELGVQQVDVSIYASNAETHDRITQFPGSFQKSLSGIECLKAAGVRVGISNVLMRENSFQVGEVRDLAVRLGASYVLDPTVTPMIDGNPAVVVHRAELKDIAQAFRDFNLGQRPGEVCLPPDSDSTDAPCSAGHSMVYINPAGLVYPCVQFPMFCGDLRKDSFAEIWRSRAFVQLREVRVRDLPVCSQCAHIDYCTRCPGLAWMEGDVRGISTVDCEKSEARTGELAHD